MFTDQQQQLIRVLLDEYGLYNRFRKRDLQALAGRNIDKDFAALMGKAFMPTIGLPGGYVLDCQMVDYKPEILIVHGRGRVRSTPEEMAYEECNIVPNIGDNLLYRSVRQGDEWGQLLWDAMVHNYLYSARQSALGLAIVAVSIHFKRRALEGMLSEHFRKRGLNPVPVEDIMYQSLESEIGRSVYRRAELLAELAQKFADAVYYYGSIEDAREANQRSSSRRFDPVKSPQYVLPSHQRLDHGTASAASTPLPTGGLAERTPSRHTQPDRPAGVTPYASTSRQHRTM